MLAKLLLERESQLSPQVKADSRYYILRDEMLRDLTQLVSEQLQNGATWQVSYMYLWASI